LKSRLVLVAAGLSLACSGIDDGSPLEPDGSVAGASAGGSGGGTGGGAPAASPRLNPLGRPRCLAPAGFTGSPRTTEEAVVLLNALPKPTSVACFVETLPRPLAIYATNSPFSAQPAFSSKSPRVFIKLAQLWVSVVIEGDSSYLLEFGYRPPEAELTSIKGELKFPLYDAVPLSAPYDRVRTGANTACGACHYNEAQSSSIEFASAFASIAFRPRPDSHIGLPSLVVENATCNWSETPHRCEMLSAIFDDGPVVEAAFPDGMATFF
jgi:hypothetical protein